MFKINAFHAIPIANTFTPHGQARETQRQTIGEDIHQSELDFVLQGR
jgi:hypothetical protein